MDDKHDVLVFPCVIPLKAVGEDPADFEAFVVEIVRKHVPDLAEDAAASRLSTGGHFLAVTVTFTADSRAQLETIYQELSGHKRVKFLI